ncbi:MAG: NAD-dependent epimerase/dehydratase family protein [Lachnospiraceae bacterium]|nr:NAD-dependent epimerase/dehydratase family protein [Lachnospiraceae bacterium]MDE7434612.1 NAD-dependent epimerase/dehydratase family protein [Lachnospiraceae bacterium]
MTKKILVLGGNGFIGSNLCAYLAERGEQVYSFDMTRPQRTKRGITYLEGDFFDDYTLAQVVRDKDVIYHAICTLNPGNSNEKYIMGYERDFVQTVKLCSYIKDMNSRLIFLSSGGTVYGNQNTLPIRETAVPVPINHYGNLKLCIENTIRTFNFQMKKSMLVARISNPYGPGQDYQKGVGFIDAAIKRAIRGEVVQIWGDGSVIRDYIYITDVCRMLYALIDYQGEDEVFNLSSNTGTSQNGVIDAIRELEPGVETTYFPARNVDARKIILDNARILALTGEKLVTLEEGIGNYYRYIRSSMEEGE